MKWLAIVLMIGALWWGGQSTFTALKNRDQRTLSCADYERSRPDADWLQLTGCYFDFDDSASESVRGGASTTAFIPLRSAPGKSGQPIQLFLVTKDKQILEFIRAVDNNDADRAGALATDLALDKPQTLTGLVQFGMELKDKERAKLAELFPHAAKDFALLEHNAKPKLGLGLGVLAAGLVLAGWQFMRLVRRKQGLA